MEKDKHLGQFEQLILLALLRLGDTAYGMMVRREIEGRADRSVSLGAVYATLDRLERKGYVRSHAGPAAPERGGRARRFFAVTGSGRRQLDQVLRASDRMRKGLGDLGLAQETA